MLLGYYTWYGATDAKQVRRRLMTEAVVLIISVAT